MATTKKNSTSTPEIPKDGLATVTQVAKALAVSTDTIYREVREKKIKSVEIREAIRVPWSEVHRILSSAN